MWLMGKWLVPAASGGWGAEGAMWACACPRPLEGTWFTVWMTGVGGGVCGAMTRVGRPGQKPQDGRERAPAFGLGLLVGAEGPAGGVFCCGGGCCPREVGRRQGHRLGVRVWVRRQRAQGPCWAVARQLWVGAMAQLMWAQASLVLLHVLVYVVLTLCGGTRRGGTSPEGLGTRAWRSRCPQGSGDVMGPGGGDVGWAGLTRSGGGGGLVVLGLARLPGTRSISARPSTGSARA